MDGRWPQVSDGTTVRWRRVALVSCKTIAWVAGIFGEHQLITVRLRKDRGGSDACKRGIPLDDTLVGDVVVGLEAVAVNKE